MADYICQVIDGTSLVGGVPTSAGAQIVPSGSTPPSATRVFDQKVWDSGSGGRWCYFSKDVVDPSPASNETTPNYTGSISTHIVIGTREG